MSKEQILIIYDEPLVRRRLADYLTACGYETTVVADGAAGLAQARTGQFHAVIMDPRVPHVDGLEIIAALHAERPLLPIVVISGADVLSDALGAMRQGAWDYVTTPIQDEEEVAIVVERVLEKARLLTERERAEEALRESEERYRSIFEQAADSIVLIDAENGSLVEFNDRACENLGYTREEFQELKVSDFEILESPEEVAQHIEKVARGGSDTFETKHRTKDGELRDILVSARAISIRGRNLIQSIWRDITERKQAEAEAQRRVAQLALLNEVGGKIAAVLDLDSALGRAARLVQESFGYHHVGLFTLNREGDELVMRARAGDFVHLFSPDHRLKLGQGMVGWVARHGETLLANDVDAEPHYVNLYPDLVPTRSELSVPIKASGEILGVLDIQSPRLNDFDESDVMVMETLADQIAVAIENARLHRKVLDHAEQLEQRVQERTAELQTQYARLDAILRSTADGIIVTDAEGEIIQANPVAQAWLTHSLSPQDAGRLQETVQDLARRAGERPEAMLELKGLDLELKAAPISETGTEEASAVVTVHDVSELKALDRMKTRFVTNISHELRTPITTLKLYAALMQQTPPETWGEYLAPLTQEIEWLVRLVEDILRMSRVDAGRLEMKPRRISLNELATTAVSRHRKPAREQGLILEYRPAEPDPMVMVDADQQMLALASLLTNAIQYTPAGGKVTVSTARQEAEGRVWATVTVADTGMGIPEEELSHVFDRFFRGAEPRSMQISGTGLGLALVKETVELHGGRVTAESQVGKGSVFTIWLPSADQ